MDYIGRVNQTYITESEQLKPRQNQRFMLYIQTEFQYILKTTKMVFAQFINIFTVFFKYQMHFIMQFLL